MNVQPSTRLSNQVNGTTTQSTGRDISYPGKSSGEFRNESAFAAIRDDGSVVAWGNSLNGGDSSGVSSSLDGSLDVLEVYSTKYAFAALRSDGSVVTWGDGTYGGDSSAVASALNGDVDVVEIYSSGSSFAALRSDGSVVTWGSTYFGGDSTEVSSELNGDVVAIYSGEGAFAAVRSNGSVITWGDSSNGGDSSAVSSALNGDIDVVEVKYAGGVFAALRSDGSVITWGDSYYNSGSASGDSITPAPTSDIDIMDVYAGRNAFAGVRSDGSVVTWGRSSYGGDSSGVSAELNGNIGVVKVYATNSAFAALRTDGSVITWGSTNSTAVSAQLNGDIDVTDIYTSIGAFAAVRSDGSVVTWGANLFGGDSSGVSSELNGDIHVVGIYSTGTSFAALRSDGSVITWGSSSVGGDSSSVSEELDGRIDVVEIYATGAAFAALRSDGSVVTWGRSDRGGDSSAVANELTNVVSLADPYTSDKGTEDIIVKSSVTSIVAGAGEIADEYISEGETVSYTVSFNKTTTSTDTYAFAIGGQVGASDYAPPTFDSGVTLDTVTGLLTVPSGVDSFTVSLPIKQDGAQESEEAIELSVGGVSHNLVKVVDSTLPWPDAGRADVFARHEGTFQHDDASHYGFDHGLVSTLADFAKAAYSLGDWEKTGDNRYINDVADSGGGVGSGRHADDVKAALLDGSEWSPIQLSIDDSVVYLKQEVENPTIFDVLGINDLDVSTQWMNNTSLIPDDYQTGQLHERLSHANDYVYATIENKFENGLYTYGGSAAIVARNEDTAVIAFRGTNDNRNSEADAGAQNPVDTHNYYRPDVGDWNDMDNHYENFQTLIEAFDFYLEHHPEITKVYVTGHSLGGAMAIAYMAEHGGDRYQAVTFAAPDYGFNEKGFNESEFDRSTHIEIQGDPVPELLNANDPPGNIVHFHGNQTTEGGEDNHSMEYYRNIAANVDNETWGYLLSRSGEKAVETEVLLGGSRFSSNGTEQYYVASGPDAPEVRYVIDNPYRIVDVFYGGDNRDLLSGGVFTKTGSDLISETFFGGSGNDVIDAKGGADTLYGGTGKDELKGGTGDDTLIGGAGDDLIYGGDGIDIAKFNINLSEVLNVSKNKLGGVTIISPEGVDKLYDIENLHFLNSNATIDSLVSVKETPVFSIQSSGQTGNIAPKKYVGPVAFLEYELLGNSVGDTVVGSHSNDFINLLGGDDAANGGLGDDVLDGGTGSNFLTGGGGDDTLFLDGRGGSVTWSTVTDFDGDEVNIWGWNDGVSKLLLVQDSAGAEGYSGATYHYDLNNDSSIDTSLTFTGFAQGEVPEATAQIVADNGYLLFS